jgi:hypothetical protein
VLPRQWSHFSAEGKPPRARDLVSAFRRAVVTVIEADFSAPKKELRSFTAPEQTALLPSTIAM